MNLVLAECAAGSPAAKAGLQPGDVLVRFAGFVVTDLAAFNAVVARNVVVGATLPVEYRRDGVSQETSLAFT